MFNKTKRNNFKELIPPKRNNFKELMFLKQYHIEHLSPRFFSKVNKLFTIQHGGTMYLDRFKKRFRQPGFPVLGDLTVKEDA